MEHFKFTRIAHADHLFHSPISAEKLDRVAELAGLSPGARVVDFGCGNGEVLIRLAERYGAAGVGVDISPFALQEARERAGRRAPGASLEFVERPGAEYAQEAGPCDLAVCIGAGHTFGGFSQTLRTLAGLLNPGGHLLVGELFWRQSPDAEYLQALGANLDDYRTHAGNVALAREVGLRFLYAAVSSEDDWDHYEGLYGRAVERYVASHPEDPDCEAMLKRIRGWQDLYLQHGRETLGFALYLFSR